MSHNLFSTLNIADFTKLFVVVAVVVVVIINVRSEAP
jgi:hypothetical protein